MAVISTYSQLVQAIKDVAEDDGEEFSAYIPIAVSLAEDMLFKTLDLPELETTIQGSLVQGQHLLTKPSGVEMVDHIAVDGSLLKNKGVSFIVDYWPNTESTDKPKYYCNWTPTTWRIAPTPSSAYAYSIRYTSKPSKLGATGIDTNYYLEKCYDILLAACLVEMMKFNKSTEQLSVWEKYLSGLQEAWNVQMKRYRRDGGSVPMSTTSGPNTLIHTINSGA